MSYVSRMNTAQSLPKICQTSLAAHLRPDLFKALSDPVRISIVATLAAQPKAHTVSDLTACCGIDMSGVSRHLKILRDAGVVTAHKQGRDKLYELKTQELAESLRAMADALLMCQNTHKT